jgi:hypothetical protein
VAKIAEKAAIKAKQAVKLLVFNKKGLWLPQYNLNEHKNDPGQVR